MIAFMLWEPSGGTRGPRTRSSLRAGAGVFQLPPHLTLPAKPIGRRGLLHRTGSPIVGRSLSIAPFPSLPLSRPPRGELGGWVSGRMRGLNAQNWMGRIGVLGRVYRATHRRRPRPFFFGARRGAWRRIEQELDSEGRKQGRSGAHWRAAGLLPLLLVGVPSCRCCCRRAMK